MSNNKIDYINYKVVKDIIYDACNRQLFTDEYEDFYEKFQNDEYLELTDNQKYKLNNFITDYIDNDFKIKRIELFEFMDETGLLYTDIYWLGVIVNDGGTNWHNANSIYDVMLEILKAELEMYINRL